MASYSILSGNDGNQTRQFILPSLLFSMKTVWLMRLTIKWYFFGIFLSECTSVWHREILALIIFYILCKFIKEYSSIPYTGLVHFLKWQNKKEAYFSAKTASLLSK